MNSPDPGPAREAPDPSLDDDPDARALRESWRAAYRPTTPIAGALIDQATLALDEKRRLVRIRATLRAEAARTADVRWEHAREDEVDAYRQVFNDDPHAAVKGLRRSAAGCRYLVDKWARLAALLAAEGTWYGIDRIDAVQLQGHSALVRDLYFSEAAYMTWLDCLAAQPNPKRRDIDLVCGTDVVPKALQDKDFVPWPQDPAQSRARLQALVARELPPLRALEAKLRVADEGPSRAAAVDLALARLVRDEASLLRAQQVHERSFERAAAALLQLQRQAAGPDAARAIEGRPVIPTANGAEPAPPTGNGTGRRRSPSPALRGLQEICEKCGSFLREAVAAEAAVEDRTEPKPAGDGRLPGGPAPDKVKASGRGAADRTSARDHREERPK